MGVYNIELLYVFQQAVKSVLNQTIGDFEFIICDDGSTDRTWSLLLELAREDRRIRLVRNPINQGLAAALNHCLIHAHGGWIARQDADDMSAPDRFQLQMHFLESHPEIDFVGSAVTLWDEGGVWRKRVFPEYPQPRDFLFTMPFVHGALMFRKAALEAVGGYRVAKDTRRAEDYDMLMRMYALGIRGANLRKPLYAFQEDHAAQQRRRYRYRLDEAVVRWKGFSQMGLMPGALPYVVKPLVVGLLPQGALRNLKQKRSF